MSLAMQGWVLIVCLAILVLEVDIFRPLCLLAQRCHSSTALHIVLGRWGSPDQTCQRRAPNKNKSKSTCRTTQIKLTANWRHHKNSTGMEIDKCNETVSNELSTLTHPFFNAWLVDTCACPFNGQHLLSGWLFQPVILSPDTTVVWFQPSCKLHCPKLPQAAHPK